MKNIFRLLILTALVFVNTSCINKKMSNTLEVSLQETVPVSLSCGNISYAIGFKFKILSGSDEGKILIGIVKCPDIYGAVFIEGAKFKIEISSDMNDLKTYQIFNSYKDAKLSNYSVTKLEIAK